MAVVTVPVAVAVSGMAVGLAVGVGGSGVLVGWGVWVGSGVADGRITGVDEAGIAVGEAATAEGAGFTVCSRNAGMHAFKRRDRPKTGRSNFFMAQLLEGKSILRSDFHELGYDVTQHPFG